MSMFFANKQDFLAAAHDVANLPSWQDTLLFLISESHILSKFIKEGGNMPSAISPEVAEMCFSCVFGIPIMSKTLTLLSGQNEQLKAHPSKTDLNPRMTYNAISLLVDSGRITASRNPPRDVKPEWIVSLVLGIVGERNVEGFLIQLRRRIAHHEASVV